MYVFRSFTSKVVLIWDNDGVDPEEDKVLLKTLRYLLLIQLISNLLSYEFSISIPSESFKVSGIVIFGGQVAAATLTPFFENRLQIGSFLCHFLLKNLISRSHFVQVADILNARMKSECQTF